MEGLPKVEWLAFKANDAPITDGIPFDFWDSFGRQKLQALIEKNAGAELSIVGYETIQALGDPRRGPDIPEPGGDTIFAGSDQGAQPWAVRRKLVIMEIENPAQ